MNDALPLCVFVSSGDRGKDDDCSEVTFDNGTESSRNEGVDLTRIIAMMNPSDIIRPSLSSWDGQMIVDILPSQEKRQQLEGIDVKLDSDQQKKNLEEKHELADLKLENAKQKNAIKLLLSKLSKSQVENEALKAEKESLIEELALVRCDPEIDIQQRSTSLHARLMLQEEVAGSKGGCVRMLLDMNARLMAENYCLRANVNGVRHCLRSNIRHSQFIRQQDEETLEDLQQENELMWQQSNHSVKSPTKYGFDGEDTSNTSLTSGNTSDENVDNTSMHLDSQLRLMKQNGIKVNSYLRALKFKRNNKVGISGDKWNTESEGTKADDVDKEEKKVEEKEKVLGRATPSEGLLVDFGETPRPRRTARSRRWSLIM